MESLASPRAALESRGGGGLGRSLLKAKRSRTPSETGHGRQHQPLGTIEPCSAWAPAQPAAVPAPAPGASGELCRRGTAGPGSAGLRDGAAPGSPRLGGLAGPELGAGSCWKGDARREVSWPCSRLRRSGAELGSSG